MRILFASDLHVSVSHLPSLLGVASIKGADCIIIGGDLVPRERRGGSLREKIDGQRAYLQQELIPGIEGFRKNHSHVEIFLDMGNDDFAANRDLLEDRSGELFHLLHMAKHPLTESVDVIGYMCVPPTPFHLKDWEKPDSRDVPVISEFFEISGLFTAHGTQFRDLDLSSEDTIERDMEILSTVVERPFVFVSHSPPHGTDLDLIGDGVSHVGSRSIRQFIERWSAEGSLIASFHGHIHESADVSGKNCWMAGDTPCYNPGQPGGELRYIIEEIP